jgi:imidazole glycerol-phosphate synthase subunit HisH
MQTVVVLDYGMSNLRSVAKALEYVSEGRHRVLVSGRPDDLARADRIVFPGQGAIGNCMEHITAMGLDRALREVLPAKPFLGICLGLQSLMEWSEEGGGTPGLGVYPGQVVRFPRELHAPASEDILKVPHMGWNQVWPAGPHPLWAGIAPGERFYFVHSFFVLPKEEDLTAAYTEYGVRFTAALARGHVFAVQFHPEKSQQPGLRLLKNFLHWDGSA